MEGAGGLDCLNGDVLHEILAKLGDDASKVLEAATAELAVDKVMAACRTCQSVRATCNAVAVRAFSTLFSIAEGVVNTMVTAAKERADFATKVAGPDATRRFIDAEKLFEGVVHDLYEYSTNPKQRQLVVRRMNRDDPSSKRKREHWRSRASKHKLRFLEFILEQLIGQHGSPDDSYDPVPDVRWLSEALRLNDASGGSRFGPIEDWDVSAVTDMSAMFEDVAAFNGDLSAWDVSNVAKMNYMFAGAAAFNRDLSAWEVGNVKEVCSMFCRTNAFDGNISTWNVSNVINMQKMFEQATAFNGDLSALCSYRGGFWRLRSFPYRGGFWWLRSFPLSRYRT